MNQSDKNKLLKALTDVIDNFKSDATREVMEITTLDEVIAAANENPADYIVPADATKRQRGKILYSTLELICDVFKAGVVLDPANPNQKKWYPWGEYKAGSGFSLFAVDFDFTFSDVGARLSVDTEEKARHIWKHFNYIYQDYWLEK